MNPFAYAKAASPSSALTEFSNERSARYIAGGTTILDLMKIAVEAPPLLIDINALPLASIEVTGDAIRIGALARLRDVAENEIVRSRLPFVAIALEQSASPQLRNMATIGGNLLQRTRCPYFRDIATPCNKRAPGSGCGALDGENRREAALGTSEHCIATHPSDLAVTLAALDATVHVTGLGGNREIALHDFYRVPGDTPQVETSLEPGELIVAVSLPLLSYGARSTYVKVRDRAQYDFALASAAVALDLDGSTIREARVALGGIATIPWRSPGAEGALRGAPATRASFERAAEAALVDARGRGGNDYKIPLAKRTLVRALEIAAV
ncbi:MAG TPA: xanthine dehydrogenase family protein subunit M [Candidatus Cybelea sp.]|nr:xanthine dehydrogenase family protein subunit M [Candidatus Cybelea sp.]